ncbi:hypothetical protein CL89_gp124 [Aeromonas phage PX29]|uniref:Uncharacterized protein n=1 Tax=Aeromonas phage PX29 TaxID=926067 RepID=E5DQ57_9CAUD|nr:hypothetical protein CL89_gp124 [Aeromonas phage PX29]ADQ52843.1 conserved hypothetical protein [Aeromonas phage PX29]
MSSKYQDISGPNKDIVLRNFEKMLQGQDFSQKYIPVYATLETKIMEKPLVTSSPVVIRSNTSNDMRDDDKWWRKD